MRTLYLESPDLVSAGQGVDSVSGVGGFGDPVSYVLGPFPVFADIVTEPSHGSLSPQVGPFDIGEDVVLLFVSICIYSYFDFKKLYLACFMWDASLSMVSW